MGYIQDFEREIKTLLQEGDEERVIKFLKEKVLESYRNGILAAKTVEVDKDATRKTKQFARAK